MEIWNAVNDINDSMIKSIPPLCTTAYAKTKYFTQNGIPPSIQKHSGKRHYLQQDRKSWPMFCTPLSLLEPSVLAAEHQPSICQSECSDLGRE